MQNSYSDDFKYQWVAESKSKYIFTISSDREFEGDHLTGGKNSIYELSKIDFSDFSNPRKMQSASIDLSYEKDSKFRILDFKSSLLDSTQTRTKIFLSYASNDLVSKCRYLNLVSFVLSPIGNLEIKEFKRWFRSPCMPGSDGYDFRLHQSGGAILEVKTTLNAGKTLDEVYLTVGDFIKLGYSGEQILESTRSILGSLLRVRSDGTIKIVANGFRNPQGIGYFETLNKTQIFQSEHAPRGGDELNEITEGNFYGWPDFSFGTQYGPNNPLDSPEVPNTSGSSVKPLFSWLPSIGPSKVHQVRSSVLRRYWADSLNGFFGDVIVAGMGSQTLYRLRILDSKVVYSEAIHVGFRIRSLVETENGEFVFGTDSGLRSLTPLQIWGGPLGMFIDLGQINS